MSEPNMALLSQAEIDTLIDFLSKEKKKVSVNSEVLNQESIDKLISLIRTNQNANHKFLMRLPIALAGDEQLIDFYSSADESFGASTSYELIFRVNDEDYVELYGRNMESGVLVPIAPEHVLDPKSQEAAGNWGRCLMPVAFDQIATYLHLQYARETLDQVCARFAVVMYGNEKADLPEVYLPSEMSVFNHLMNEEA